MLEKTVHARARWHSAIEQGYRSMSTLGWRVVVLALSLSALILPVHSVLGAELGRTEGRETGLPIPRFVSIKNEPAMMRAGPSRKYAIKWIYQRRGVPLEIIAEYDHWREVRDAEGETGWLHSALLSSRRTAIVAPWLEEAAPMRDAPSSSATKTALLQARVALRIYSCDGSWCYVGTRRQDVRGYVAQELIWGAYRGELIGN